VCASCGLRRMRGRNEEATGAVIMAESSTNGAVGALAKGNRVHKHPRAPRTSTNAKTQREPRTSSNMGMEGVLCTNRQGSAAPESVHDGK
jgi:hypothetical protein